MLRHSIILLLSIFMLSGCLGPSSTQQFLRDIPPSQVDGVKFTLINTGYTRMSEAATYSGGSRFKRTQQNYMAVLVEHPQGRLLFDTGLGEQIKPQTKAETSLLQRVFPDYKLTQPVKAQLLRAGESLPDKIFLSHSHWDHASGLVDFPDSEIWLPVAERQHIEAGRDPHIWSSQVAVKSIAPARWKRYEFPNQRYANFKQSYDVYGDGSVVLVPLSGHTPGSVGMFVNLPSGKSYFFCGDASWSQKALAKKKQKPWRRRSVENDSLQAYRQIERINALMQANAHLEVVPAHDHEVHQRLGFFPTWQY